MDRPAILVVDDDAEIRELAVETLHTCGYGVLAAATGTEALLLFEQHPEIDVIFTDIVMPGLDGFRLADMAKFRRPHVRILYTTGFEHRARDYLGVVHGRILRKPYRLAELTEAIAATLAVAPTK